jgi:spermidine synthase
MVLLLLITLMGGYFAIAQILYLREFLVICYGNELSIGLILSLWLLGITIGAVAGGKITRHVEHATPLFIATVALLSLILGGEIYGIRIMRSALDVQTGGLISLDKVLVGSLATLFPFTVLAGFFFPAACKMVERCNVPGTKGALSIGAVYIAEAVGSIIGGVLFTFWLVACENQFTVIAACAVLIAAVTCIFLWQTRKWRVLSALPALIIVSAAFLYAAGSLNELNRTSILARWKSFTPNNALIETRETRYQNLALGRQENLYSVFGNGHFIMSFPDVYQYAPAAHLFMSQHPRPRDVLLIGGGMGGLLEEILIYPVNTVDYVELDPQQIELISGRLTGTHRDFLDDERLKIHYVDGRHYVKNTSRQYDLVISNVADPSTAVINRYYTTNFLEEVSRILKDDGVFATKLSSAVDYMGTDITNYAGSVYQAVNAVFPLVLATPGAENFFFACRKDGIISADPAVLAERYRSAGVVTPYFSDVQFAQVLQRDRMQSLNTALKDARIPSLNTDTRPITYFFNLILWGKFSGSSETAALKHIARVPFWALLCAVTALFACVYAFQARSDPVRNLGMNSIGAITTTGLAGMAFEIIFIFMFQNIYGYVYQKIGIIVSFFMFGLAAGGFLVNYCMAVLERPNRSGYPPPSRIPLYQRLLMLFETSILVFSIATPPLIALAASRPLQAHAGVGVEIVFYALVLLSGFLTGGEFPLAGRIYFSTGQPLQKTAGFVDGFDCLGASVGALATGLITLPLYGLANTCILIASLKAGCLLLLFTNYKKTAAAPLH